MGGSEGGDLVFGLATMAAVQYLSSSSPLMRLFCRSGEGKKEEVEERKEGNGTNTHLTHTTPAHTHTHAASAANMYRLQVNNSVQKPNTFHQDLNNIRLAEARTFTSSKQFVPLFKSIQLHLFLSQVCFQLRPTEL